MTINFQLHFCALSHSFAIYFNVNLSFTMCFKQPSNIPMVKCTHFESKRQTSLFSFATTRLTCRYSYKHLPYCEVCSFPSSMLPVSIVFLHSVFWVNKSGFSKLSNLIHSTIILSYISLLLTVIVCKGIWNPSC